MSNDQKNHNSTCLNLPSYQYHTYITVKTVTNYKTLKIMPKKYSSESAGCRCRKKQHIQAEIKGKEWPEKNVFSSSDKSTTKWWRLILNNKMSESWGFRLFNQFTPDILLTSTDPGHVVPLKQFGNPNKDSEDLVYQRSLKKGYSCYVFPTALHVVTQCGSFIILTELTWSKDFVFPTLLHPNSLTFLLRLCDQLSLHLFPARPLRSN